MKDIPGYEGSYAATEDGRVWSFLSGRFLRPAATKSGHLSVALTHARGKARSRLVHHLVLEVYEGPRRPGQECRHKNGDPKDNRLGNLEWDSRSNNSRDKKWHAGQRGYKLNPTQVKEVKALIASGVPQRAIAAKFGLSRGSIHWIKSGKYHCDV